ncbi:hypothetical protein F1880_000860 [Penicillium rolfsii]|nr:hypothetical protein F1880_000860 [Penicillium rolfsii]
MYSFNSAAVAAVQNNTPEIPGMMGASLYAASKTEGERQAVKWVENHKPSFVLNRGLPDWCVSIAKTLLIRYPSLTLYKLGPRVHTEAGGPMGSMGMTSALCSVWYVNVKDAAYLHFAALLHPDIRSERIFAMAAPFNWTEVVELIRKIQPNNHKILNPPADEGHCLHEFVEPGRGEKLLREFCGQPGWTSLEDCLVAGLPTYE